MNMFIDTEFTCLPWEKGSELISVGIVLEDATEYYACSSEFNSDVTSEFVKINVLKHLPEIRFRKTLDSIGGEIKTMISRKNISAVWAVFPSIDQIEQMYQGDKTVEDIHSDFADWDYQLLQLLIGTSTQVPSYCKDLSSIISEMDKSVLPVNTLAHNALEDARWNYQVWKKWACA